MPAAACNVHQIRHSCDPVRVFATFLYCYDVSIILSLFIVLLLLCYVAGCGPAVCIDCNVDILHCNISLF
jgi:hypothetical protein